MRPSSRMLGRALQTSYDVVIAGAGIMGLHTAYQLTRQDPGLSVAILEGKPGLGHGSTGYSSALLRCLYTRDEMVDFAAAGLQVHKNWKEYLELEQPAAKFHNIPILWLTEESTDKVQHNIARMSANGLNSTALSINEVRSRFSLFMDDHEELDPARMFFCEEDTGYFDPASALIDLKDALELNPKVSFFANARVNKVLLDDADRECVTGVDVEGFGHVYGGVVVNTAGPWADLLQQQSGISHKWNVSPVRIQALYKSSPEIVTASEYEPGQLPVVLDILNMIYFRPQFASRQVLVGTADSAEEKELVDPDLLDTESIDDDRRLRYLTALHARIEALKPVGKIATFSSMYTVNFDDAHPLVGALPGYRNYLVGMGFTGHGFKIAPMVGSVLASMITSSNAPTFAWEGDNFLSPAREPITMETISVVA